MKTLQNYDVICKVSIPYTNTSQAVHLAAFNIAMLEAVVIIGVAVYSFSEVFSF